MSDIVSDSSSSSDEVPRLDSIGRPLIRPVYRSVGDSSVLQRVREFLPQFQESTGALVMDPRIKKPDTGVVLLPSEKGFVDDGEAADDSESSFGVEIDVGCGVFDVTGAFDEKTMAGIPTIYTDSLAEPDSKDNTETRLIQEIDPSD